jgi:PST family polysaccharide transporter
MLRCGLIGQLLSVMSLLFGLPWGPTGVAMSAAIFSVPIQAVMMWGATREGPVSLAHFARMLLPVGLSTMVSAALVYAVSLQLSQLSLHPLFVLTLGLLTAYAGAALALCATRPGRRIIHDARRAAQMLTQSRVAA